MLALALHPILPLKQPTYMKSYMPLPYHTCLRFTTPHKVRYWSKDYASFLPQRRIQRNTVWCGVYKLLLFFPTSPLLCLLCDRETQTEWLFKSCLQNIVCLLLRSIFLPVALAKICFRYVGELWLCVNAVWSLKWIAIVRPECHFKHLSTHENLLQVDG